MRFTVLLFVFVCAAGLRASANASEEPAATGNPPTAVDTAATAAEIEFFERHVRPVLASRCFKCHALGARSKNGLQMDSLAGLLRGGKRGPAVIPGDPAKSLLLRAIRHDLELGLKMPPDRPLPEDQIEHLSQWIEQGAKWPKSTTGKPAGADPDSERHSPTWALEPVSDPEVPTARNPSWTKSPIDRFVLAKLESAGLTPAAPADKHTLLRRVSFDLIGLPPTPEETDDFLADHSDQAFAKVVDRLLASPHYGERWGRHWLDLVRFSETNGLDFDTEKPGAYHYRDYVIEAFNEDLPYDQFVREHLAGDVLPQPRVSRDELRVSSPTATGFFWFGEMLEEDNDPVEEAGNEIENQIDVLGKCFLGMTIACARCHDHKFDPIQQDDYNAIAAALRRTSNVAACLDTAKCTEQVESTLERIQVKNRELRDLMGPVALRESERVGRLLARTEQVPAYLLAARQLIGNGQQRTKATLDEVARQAGLAPRQLQRWVDAVAASSADRGHVLYPWGALARFSDSVFSNRARALHRSIERNTAAANAVKTEVGPRGETARITCGDFNNGYGDWTPIGSAFGTAPARRPVGWQGPGGPGFASSQRGSDALVGQLVSRSFKIEKPYLNLLISGGNQPGATEVHLVMLHPAVPVRLRDRFVTGDNQRSWSRKTIDVSRYIDREAVIVVTDNGSGPGAHLMVDEVSMSDVPDEPGSVAPSYANSLVVSWLIDPVVDSAVVLAQRYRDLFVDTLRARQDELRRYAECVVADANAADVVPPRAVSPNADREFLDRWVEQHLDLLAGDELAPEADPAVAGVEASTEVERLKRDIHDLEQSLPRSTVALVSSERPRLNMAIHFPKVDDEANSYFAALSAPTVDISSPGHGRLALANWIASPDNPLTARVLVNRVWLHHFGRGLVDSPDNFGKLGDRPSHLELLDWLTRRFVESGWSIKQLHRWILLTSTYQQSSQATADAIARDPRNRLLHSMSVRRLEGECIRDSILAVSANLNRQMGGPSIPLFLSPEMRGDDLPTLSGPRDGACRRSVYLMVRRNHPTPLLSVFDFPPPDRCIGRRETSIVPSQALYLMNDVFVADQARIWAQRLFALPATDRERVQRLYREAFTRLPDQTELKRAQDFLAAQTDRYRALPKQRETAEADAWSDLCHLMYNLGDFRLVR